MAAVSNNAVEHMLQQSRGGRGALDKKGQGSRPGCFKVEDNTRYIFANINNVHDCAK